MSQMTSLTFRPPPNAEYVQGYPGIPPGGPDRPQAAVKGALEVRTGPQGVKAKWVRIELRKVETLPGGGAGSTFSDFVGPSPVNLWNASDEFSTLHSQNFSFLIRIPESIPPSISLENRAGIQYELVATVCTKGKRGFFRRRKTVVLNTQTDIFIDKHELHSTWPVYAQPESRQATNEGVTLIVDRNQTCYGPGDTISVHATLKSDNLHTVILRGFEFSLKETTVFRPGPLATSKKSAPQSKTVVVAESKSAVNTTVFGGTQCSRDLVCLLPPDHTTTSLNSARHIDIRYELNVTARFGTGPPISLDLPVIISNWQRNVSMEAIRRIGPVPSLSLLPAQPQVGSPNLNATARLPSNATLPITQSTQLPQVHPAYNTAPVTGNAGYGTALGRVDEFGGYTPTTTITAQSTSPSSTHGRSNSLAGSRSEGDRSMTTRGQMTTTPSMRFTVTNLPDSVENLSRNESVTRPRNGSVASTATGGGATRPWPSATDEKERLYNEAKAKVERLQGRVDRVVTPPPQVATPSVAAPQPINRPGATSTPWPTAADEKLRLFNEAQAAVQRTQGLEPYTSPPHTQHTRSSSDLERARSAGAAQSGPANAPTGAALFQQAMAARNEALQRQKSVPQPRTPPRDPPMPQYMTAEQEKAAYKRYEEAKRAVERVQYATYGSAAAPMGDALDEPPDDLPPPFESAAASSSLPPSVLSEKEKLRRAYEERDAAAVAVAAAAQTEPAPTYTSPPPSDPAAAASSLIPDSALAEKERLRRKYEAQDAAALGRGSPPQPPPRSTSVGSQRTQRPTPVPPAASGSRILSAAEEKALLRAKYAAEDAAAAPAQTPPRVNGTGAVAAPPVADQSGTVRPGSSSSSFYAQHQAPRHSPPPPITTATTGMMALQAPRNSPPPITTATTKMTAPQVPAASDSSTTAPPPLAPRPPVEYIRETREEDARVSRLVLNGLTPSLNDAEDAYGGRRHLEMSPFTPFSPGFDRLGTKAPGPPPPLPPKPAGE